MALGHYHRVIFISASVFFGNIVGSCADDSVHNYELDPFHWGEKALNICLCEKVAPSRHRLIASSASLTYAELGRYDRALEIGMICTTSKLQIHDQLQLIGTSAINNGDIKVALNILRRIDDEQGFDLTAKFFAITCAEAHRLHAAEFFFASY